MTQQPTGRTIFASSVALAGVLSLAGAASAQTATSGSGANPYGMSTMGPAAPAASIQASAPATVSPFADRITGDWGGARSAIGARGVTFDLESTNYLQGLVSGTKRDNDGAEYGGRLDAYLGLDTTKLGLWKGGAFRIHGEMLVGNLKPFLGGVS